VNDFSLKNKLPQTILAEIQIRKRKSQEAARQQAKLMSNPGAFALGAAFNDPSFLNSLGVSGSRKAEGDFVSGLKDANTLENKKPKFNDKEFNTALGIAALLTMLGVKEAPAAFGNYANLTLQGAQNQQAENARLADQNRQLAEIQYKMAQGKANAMSSAAEFKQRNNMAMRQLTAQEDQALRDNALAQDKFSFDRRMQTNVFNQNQQKIDNAARLGELRLQVQKDIAEKKDPIQRIQNAIDMGWITAEEAGNLAFAQEYYRKANADNMAEKAKTEAVLRPMCVGELQARTDKLQAEAARIKTQTDLMPEESRSRVAKNLADAQKALTSGDTAGATSKMKEARIRIEKEVSGLASDRKLLISQIKDANSDEEAVAYKKQLAEINDRIKRLREMQRNLTDEALQQDFNKPGRTGLPKTKYESEIRAAARRYGIDEELFLKQIHAESSFNPRATSPVGAMGLGQLMPGTARALGVTDPYDVKQNLDGAARYMAQQLKAFKGDYRLALAAYNAGPGNVRKYKGVPPFKETRNYVKRIYG